MTYFSQIHNDLSLLKGKILPVHDGDAGQNSWGGGEETELNVCSRAKLQSNESPFIPQCAGT